MRYYPAEMHTGRFRSEEHRLLVAAMLIGLLVVGCAAAQPVVSIAPASVAIETSGPRASDFPLSPAPHLSTWSSLDANPMVTQPFSGVGNQYLMSTIAYGDGFVAVGEDFQFAGANDGPVTGAIWTSPDGLAWSRIDPVPAGLASAEIDHVATDGHRLVAVGNERPLGANPADPTPIVWVSPDNVTWTRVAPKPPFERPVAGIAGGPAGFVAWTSDGFTSVVYRSDDGTHWERLPSGGQPDGLVSSIAAYRGGFVAVGAHEPPPASPAPSKVLTAGGPDLSTAAAWWSADGRTWQAGQTDAGAGLYAVMVGADGLLASGGNGCPGCVAPGIVWRSDDGRRWRNIGSDAQTMPTYASDGSRIVRLDQNSGDIVSTSTDGSHWTELAGSLGADATYGFVVGRKGILVIESLPRGGANDQVDGGVVFVAAH